MNTTAAQSLASHSAARNAAVVATRRRHPTARSAGRTPTLRRRMATMLRARGAEHPEVAAAILEARGRLGLDPACFASHLGLGVDLILRAEAGDLPAEALPPGLAALGGHFTT